MEQLSSQGEVMQIGGRRHARVNQAWVLVDSDMGVHTEEPLVTFLGLTNLGIALCLFVLGGARDGGQVRRNGFLNNSLR